VSSSIHWPCVFVVPILTNNHAHSVFSVLRVGINDPVPDKGTRVDAISYYTRELAESNKDVFVMQRRQIQVAESGNASVRAYDWLSRISDFAAGAAVTILEDSVADNDLLSPTTDSFIDEALYDGSEVPQAERMASMYGSIVSMNQNVSSPRVITASKRASLGEIPEFSSDAESWPTVAASIDSGDKSYPLLTDEEMVSAFTVLFL